MTISLADDIAAIRRVAEAWHVGWLTSNAVALLDLYAEAPTLLPQNAPVMSGRAAIREAYESVFSSYVIEGSGEVKDIMVEGGLACLWSAYRLSALPRCGEGTPVMDSGNSVFILRKEPDGAWRITHLISNSDRPAPDG